MAGCLSYLLKKCKNQIVYFLIVCEEILLIVKRFFLLFSINQKILLSLSGWPSKPLLLQRKRKLTLTLHTFHLSTTQCFSCFFSYEKLAAQSCSLLLLLLLLQQVLLLLLLAFCKTIIKRCNCNYHYDYSSSLNVSLVKYSFAF